MSWAEVPETTKAFLRETLTARQLQCWVHRENGRGYRATAAMIGCSWENVRNHLRAAELKLVKAMRDEVP